MMFEYFCNLGNGQDSAKILSPVPIHIGDKIIMDNGESVEVCDVLHYLNEEKGEVKKTSLYFLIT